MSEAWSRPESFRAAVIAVEFPYSEAVVYDTLTAAGWDERIARAALTCAAQAYGGALWPPGVHPVSLAVALKSLVDEKPR